MVNGFAEAIPEIRYALEVMAQGEITDEEYLKCYFGALHLTIILWDEKARDAIYARVERIARERGALPSLKRILFGLAVQNAFHGRLESAFASNEEASRIGRLLGTSKEQETVRSDPVTIILVLKGDEQSVRQRFDSYVEALRHLGLGTAILNEYQCLMLLEIALSNYPQAFQAGSEFGSMDPMMFSLRLTPDLIECAAAVGDQTTARELMKPFEDAARISGTPWALGLLARSSALVSPADQAGGLFEEAIVQLNRSDSPADLARAHLLYGEWLRRHRRRRDANEQLIIASKMFGGMGAAGFRARAQRGLASLSDTPLAGPETDTWGMTIQESQIARLAAIGLTNSEIAARVNISPSTVDYHLRKIYRRLGINSRRELRRELGLSQ